MLLFKSAATWLMASHRRPSSVSDRAALGAQGAFEGFANEIAAYLEGLKVFSPAATFGVLMPTQASPFSTKKSREYPQIIGQSKRRAECRISTMTFPLNREALAGRRTRMRVAYGALAVLTVNELSASQL